MPDARAAHAWQFFRSGGFDQVRLTDADDLRHLGSLDLKLWAVLACPSAGLEFDARTLQLLDRGGEGRVRATDVQAAVAWVCKVLRDPQILFEGGDDLPLASIREDDDEGARLLATARQVLVYLGRPDDARIALADLADPTKLYEPGHFNGDGVIPAEITDDARLAESIATIAACLGANEDRSGRPGIDAAALEAFAQGAAAVSDWHARAEGDQAGILALGAATADAVAAFDAVRAKVEDFFTRCQLAAFDTGARDALNPAPEAYAGLATTTLSADAAGVAALPLARIAPDARLPLAGAVNPAWRDAVAALRELVVDPLLGPTDELDFAQWRAIAARLEAWRAWQADRPDTPVAALEVGALRAWLASDAQSQLAELIARDDGADTAAAQIEALERLLRLRRDLVTLLRNFVNLADFYGRERKAIFQAGTLYIDQRSCELCLRVGDAARHAAMAGLSGTFLVYCQCTRAGEDPITIVAAMTGGEVDEMMVPGRNGVFYDRDGRDWQASVTRIVPNPISVRQAFWSPYRRIARMIGEQVLKFASAQDKAIDARAAAGIAGAEKSATTAATAPPPPAAAPGKAPAPPAPSPAFDIAKFAGIFAAMGLALGALGTALAAIVGAFLALPVWKMPLVLAGIVLLISGPSMLLAWFKLRQRNLGPLLDANGWAVNTRARINLPFGASLTGLAQLPPGARRSLIDPFADVAMPAWQKLLIAAVVAGLAYLAYRG
jgi:hypothetical protein